MLCAVYVGIFVHFGGRTIPVEPPASFVFLGTVAFVVVIILVVGAEPHALVTRPLRDTNMEISTQSISSGSYIGSKRESVVILQKDILQELVNNRKT